MTSVTIESPSSRKDESDRGIIQRRLTNRRSRILNILGIEPAAPSTKPPFLSLSARSHSVGPSASVSRTTVHAHGHRSGTGGSVSSGSLKKRTRSRINIMDLGSVFGGTGNEMRDLGLAEVEHHEWRISVASDGDHPDGDRCVIYADTPINMYTLFRTIKEIRQLHDKLVPAVPAADLPSFPSTALREVPKSPSKRNKLQRSSSRRSSFLASFTSKLGAVLDGPQKDKERRQQHDAAMRSPPLSPGAPQLLPLDSTMFSPISSPSGEMEDPFATRKAAQTTVSLASALSSSSNLGASEPTVQARCDYSAITAYLTSLANSSATRSNRHWKSFLRVRRDDFESVRVERKVKRTRSVQLEQSSQVPLANEADFIDGSILVSTRVSSATTPLMPEDRNPLDLAELTTAVRGDHAEELEHIPRKSPTATTVPNPKELPAVVEEEEGTVKRHKVDSRPEVPAEWKADGQETGATLDSAPKRTKKLGVKLEDFELIRVVGKGCAGKVLLVRFKRTGEIFAMKTIHKRHVLAHQELQHTLTEQKVLKRMSRESTNPFVIHMHFSFTDRENLYLVLDFHPGGDLATQLERWGRIGRDRARFYSAEIVEGVEALHDMGIIYRDLKPENVLLAADGHVVLVDFGLAAEFPHRAKSNLARRSAPSTPAWMTSGNTASRFGQHWGYKERDLATSFVGTAEYLAPEVIQGFPYSYEVDWWSLGTMLYEALVGVTPYWANNHAEMYTKVLHNELTFPEDYPIDQDTKSFIRGLLQKDPQLRLTEPRIKKHAYFSMIDFEHIRLKRYIPPYTPDTDQSKEYDTQNFSRDFLEMEATVDMREGEEIVEEPLEALQQRDEAFRTYSFVTRPPRFSGDDLAEDDREEQEEQRREGCNNSSDAGTPIAGQNKALPAAPSSKSLSMKISDSLSDSLWASYSDGNTPAGATGSEDGVQTPVALFRIEQDDDVTSPDQPHLLIQEHSAALEDMRNSCRSQNINEEAKEEDDWERVEDTAGAEAQNGTRAATLFARGVVDRYRMNVLRHRDSALSRSTSSLRLGSRRRSTGLEDVNKDNKRLLKLRVKLRSSRGSTPPSSMFGTSGDRSNSGLSPSYVTSGSSATSSPLASPSASTSSIVGASAVPPSSSMSTSTNRSTSPTKARHPKTGNDNKQTVRIKSLAATSTEALKSWIHKTGPSTEG